MIKRKTTSDALNEAYKLVYEDLCKNHSHVMALFNGTLHPDDLQPEQRQVAAMIMDIVQHGAKSNSMRKLKKM